MTLLERQEEAGAIEAALDGVVEGAGALLVIEGEAGAGKSSLLELAVSQARSREAPALRARGIEQERDFPYGVVRQLLEARVRSDQGELLGGAAALCAPIFDLGAEPNVADRLSIQHGLYWLVSNLASDGPLLVLLDDAQWADLPSLAALSYVARRLGDLPLAMVVAIRIGEPDSPEEVLDELRREAADGVLRPDPLSGEAALTLGREQLGTDASQVFVTACNESCGGNPFLLIELMRGLKAEEIAPTDENAALVAEYASEGLTRSIVVRLHRLGEEAVEVARAAAILGPSSEAEHLADLAGLSVEETVAACERLIGARILENTEPVSFVHPLTREAVYAELSAPRRALLHSQAAERLGSAGGPTDAVAAQLMHTPPAGNPRAVAALRAAAADARSRGAPDAAAVFLERALAEPPEAPELLSTSQAFGSALLEAADPRGIDELLAVRTALEDPRLRAQLSIEVGTSLALRGRAPETLVLVDESLAELAGPAEGDPELADLLAHLQAIRYMSFIMSGTPVEREDLERDVELVRGERIGERALLMQSSLLLTAGLGSVPEAVEHLERTVVDPDALVSDALAGSNRGNVAIGLVADDRTEPALTLLKGQIEANRNRGASTSLGIVTSYQAFVRFTRGELDEAEVDAGLAVQLIDATGLEWGVAAAMWVRVRIERNELEDLDEFLIVRGLDGELRPGLDHASLLCARGDLNNAMARYERAQADFTAARRALEWLPYANPEFLGWRRGLAIAELGLGHQSEAERLADEGVRVARAAGGKRGLGLSLRIRGVVRGADGTADLRQAIDILSGTEARLEHTHALVDLGAALRRANQRREARGPLREGLDLAHRLGAHRLEDRARAELTATGARPRKAVLSGAEALTPSEMRVARMAAEGMTNREIAQELFVSLKTVEYHLRHCYQKLDIKGRGELTSALAR